MVRVAGLEDRKVRIALNGEHLIVKGTGLYCSIIFDRSFVENIWRKTRGIFPKNLKVDMPIVVLTGLDSGKNVGRYDSMGRCKESLVRIYVPDLIRQMNQISLEINEDNLMAFIGSILVHEFTHHLYFHKGIHNGHHKLMISDWKISKVREKIINQYGDNMALAKISFFEAWVIAGKDGI